MLRNSLANLEELLKTYFLAFVYYNSYQIFVSDAETFLDKASLLVLPSKQYRKPTEYIAKLFITTPGGAYAKRRFRKC